MARRQVTAILAAVVVVIALAVAAIVWWRSAGSSDSAATFQVIVVKPGNFLAEEEQEAAEAGGKVPVDAIDFGADQLTLPMADVQRAAVGGAFLDLLRRTTGSPATVDASAVFRVIDGLTITSASGDAVAGGNMSVLVVPHDILMLFGDEHTGFLIIRTRVSGFQLG